MKQLTQSEIRKNGKVYKNVSSPATEGTMKQVTDIVEKDGTFSISTDGGKTYSPASGATSEALPQEASALKSGNLPTSGWTKTGFQTFWEGTAECDASAYKPIGTSKELADILYSDDTAYMRVDYNYWWYGRHNEQNDAFSYKNSNASVGSMTGISFRSSYQSDNPTIFITRDGTMYGRGSNFASSAYSVTYTRIGTSTVSQQFYTISDTSITANSDILMELTDEGGVKAYSMEAGKMTVIRDTVPTQPIPYTYKVKQTNASGQFTLVNHFVPTVPVTSVNGQTGAVIGLATTDEVNKKQNTLTPGDNISIVSNTISVTGLGTAAFKNTGDFATAAQGALAASAVQTVVTSTKDGNISVDGTDVAVKGLKTLAFKDSLAKADVDLGNVENKPMDTAPTANSENYVTSGGVRTYIDNVIAAVEQFQYEVVSVLPAASADTMGKIYLVADKHSSTDNYDEFITLDNKGAYVWEKIGNTDIDLSGYVKNTTTIAGVDFKDNITKTELLTALNVADGATKVNEATVTGWGFTKNKGTVNSIKMNGKPVTITDGAVDFGTVITSHQSLDSKQDKITSSSKLDASLVSGLAKVATTGSYTDLSNKPTILSEADIKGIKVNNATYADSAGYVKNSIVCQGVGMNADANYSNFVTYDGSAARSIKFYKYDFQMLDALGSGDAELTLRNTGVTAGTYNSVTVDTKGRVTAGTNTPAIDTSEFVPKSAFSLSGTTLTITI